MNYEIIEEELDNLTTENQVREAAQHILSKNNKFNDTETMAGGDIYTAAKREFPRILGTANKNTFIQYLSKVARDPESVINCRGRRQGYYIAESAVELTPQDAAEDGGEVLPLNQPGQQVGAIVSRRERESQLYPFLKAWLISQGYRAQDVSSGRILGRWGNPDIAGVGITDIFQGVALEIVTIEAKVSIEDWERWIFEAVSHRRFANRSYFAFAHPEETIHKVPQDMRYYSELFGVGVLALSIDNAVYQELQTGQEDLQLDSDAIEIIEIYSAPFHFVQPKYQMKFCNAMKIDCQTKLYGWGDNN